YCCCVRNFLRAFRMGSSSSTTRIWTGPVTSATAVLLRGQPSLTCHEGDLHRPREQARTVGASEQLGYGLSAGRSVVHRVGVDVHPDEPINASLVEAAAVRRRVREGLGAVREAVLNAGLEVAGDVPHQRVSQVATHDVAAERQRQARLVVPPFAEIDPEVQPAVCVRQLALVDEEPRVRPTRRHVLLDLIERHDDVARRRLIQLECEVRRGELAGNCDEEAPRTERRPRISGARGARPTDPRAALGAGSLLIAVTGELTTAYLALKLYQPAARHVVVPFDQIEDYVAAGRADAGLLIHEGQLTYGDRGLHLWVDMGEWWYEETHGLPLPLGGNVVRRDLGAALMRDIARDLKASIQYGLRHRAEALAHAKGFSRGLDDTRTDRFIGMYVNAYT